MKITATEIERLSPGLTAVSFLALWSLAVQLWQVPEYLIPAPWQVFRALVSEWPEMLSHSLTTAFEAGLGFLLGTSFGFLMGVIFAHVRILERMFQPYLVALQAVPVVAIAPLLVIWFGSGILGKVFLAAFISFFPVVVATTYGLRRVRTETLDLLQILSAKPHQVFFKLRLPYSLPFIFSALRVSATLSVIGAIVAEIAGANAGIGHRIMIASYRTETAAMFAAIGCASLLGLLFYGVVRTVGEYLLTNHDHEFTGI